SADEDAADEARAGHPGRGLAEGSPDVGRDTLGGRVANGQRDERPGQRCGQGEDTEPGEDRGRARGLDGERRDQEQTWADERSDVHRGATRNVEHRAMLALAADTAVP